MPHSAGQALSCHLPPLPVPVFPKLDSCPLCFLSSCSLFPSHFLSNLSLLLVFVRPFVPKRPVCQWQMLLCSDAVHLVLTLQSPAFQSALAPLAFTEAAWPSSGCPDYLLVAPVSKPDRLCPHLPALPSVLALGQALILDVGELLTAIPPAPCRPHPAAVWLPWVWPHGPAMEGGSFLPDARLQELCPRVSSTDIPQGEGRGQWQSAVVASPTLCQEEREKGTGMEKGRRRMGKREKWSRKESENRTHTAAGLLQDHARLWLGCQAHVVSPTKPIKEGPSGTSTREGTLPPWGRGFLGWQQDIIWNSTKSVTFHLFFFKKIHF